MANAAAITAILKRATDAGDVPGVVASVGDRNGTLYEGSAGVRSLTSGAPMTSDTVFWIASMTKAVTATCAMQLIERGKLALDAPVANLLPELGRVQVLDGFDDNGEAKLRAPKRAITLRHLLTHTSGFSYNMWSQDMKRYQALKKIPNVGSGLNTSLTTPLLFDPGDRWEYGISIDWVGKAVEQASGMKLGQYMKTHIFDPLAMHDTGFKLGDSQSARRASVHVRKPEGLVATSMVVEQNPEFEGGGGGLYSTVTDYMKFARMILNGGTLNGARVLSTDTVATMSKNAMGPTRCGVMTSADPGSSNDVNFTQGMEWGLSFMINAQKLATGRSPGSLAWAGLANSYYWIDPTKGMTGVLATQVLPFADAKALKLFQDFETEVYRQH